MKGLLKRIVLIVLAAATLLALAAGLSGCSSKNREVLFTVGGTKVRADMFNMSLFFVKYSYFYNYIDQGYMTLSNLMELDTAMLETVMYTDEEGTDYTLADFLKENTAESCVTAIVMGKFAKKNGIKLTSEDKKSIKESKKQFISQLGGSKAYDDFCKKIGSSDGSFDDYMESQLLISKAYTLFEQGGKFAFTEEEIAEVKEKYAQTYVTVRHILFNTVNLNDKSYPPLSDEEIAEQQALAQQVLARIKNGEDFDDMAEEYSADMTGSFTFRDGEMDENFSDAAFELRVGQVSDLVESAYGYHIIIRDKLSDERYEEFYNAALADKFNTLVQAQVDATKIKPKKAYENLTITG